jgi:hypothetical protein
MTQLNSTYLLFKEGVPKLFVWRNYLDFNWRELFGKSWLELDYLNHLID